MIFVTERVPSRVYRVTRFADALTFTAWEFINASTPGRWDDPRSEYRVLYAADKPVAALVEVLQDLRRRPEAERIVHDVVDDASIDSPFDEFPPFALVVVFDRLRDRRLAELLRLEDSANWVVKVTEPGSRTRLEQELGSDSARGVGHRLRVEDWRSHRQRLRHYARRVAHRFRCGRRYARRHRRRVRRVTYRVVLCVLRNGPRHRSNACGARRGNFAPRPRFRC